MTIENKIMFNKEDNPHIKCNKLKREANHLKCIK